MAQYYAVIESRDGEATRCGDKKTGMTVRVNGWTRGVTVHVCYNEVSGCDVFTIYDTRGSNVAGGDEVKKVIAVLSK